MRPSGALRVSARALIALCLLAAGCATDDPIPRYETISELQLEEGDASGNEWSGRYRITATQRTCSCDRSEADEWACATLGSVHELARNYDVTQDDGFLWADSEEFQLTGPIDADGSLILAGYIIDRSYQIGTTFPIIFEAQLEKGDPDHATGIAYQWLLGEHKGTEVVCESEFDMDVERLE